MSIWKTITFLSLLTPFVAEAADISKELTTTGKITGSASPGSGIAQITRVRIEVVRPDGGIDAVFDRNFAYGNGASVTNADIGSIPYTYNQFGTYTVRGWSWQQDIYGQANQSSQATRTTQTFNPFVDKTVSVNLRPTSAVPPGWLLPSSTTTKSYRIFKYNAPSSFTGGTNNHFNGETAMTGALPSQWQSLLQRQPNAIAGLVTWSPGVTQTISTNGSGQVPITFTYP